MSDTTTIPLTTIFTPPADCATSWTYEGTYYNSDPRGVLMQNLDRGSIDTTCFPESWFQYGRAGDYLEVYSPGWCPVGYSTAQQGFTGAMTTAVCCPSGYAYTTYYADINYNNESQEFRGCTGTFAQGSTTTVPARAGDTDLTTTVVSGPIGMWAQPITVAFRQQDLALFVTTTTTSSTTAASTSEPTMTGVSTTGSSTPTASSTGSSQNSSETGLSGGAIAGIVIGAAAVLGILIGLALFFRRRKPKTTAPPALPQVEPQMEWKPSPKPNPPPVYQSPEPSVYHEASLANQQGPKQYYGGGFAEADSQAAMVELASDRRRAELA